MAAPPLSPENARELADLRLRAYGPGADIQRDPGAQRRLRELELMVRDPPGAQDSAPALRPAPAPAKTPTPNGAGPVEHKDAEASLATESKPDAAPDPDAAPATNPDAPQDAAPAPPARAHPLWRRPAVWAVAAVSLVLGVVIGLTSVWASTDRPDLTLELTTQPAERGDNWERALSAWGFEPGSVVPFQPYNGLGVWTARSDSGARCVLVSSAASPLTASCAAADLDPTLDLTVWEGMDMYFADPPPVGTVIRFVARQRVVDVWERLPGGAERDQSLDTSWSDWSPSTP